VEAKARVDELERQAGVKDAPPPRPASSPSRASPRANGCGCARSASRSPGGMTSPG